jgi:hypothetical protein
MGRQGTEITQTFLEPIKEILAGEGLNFSCFHPYQTPYSHLVQDAKKERSFEEVLTCLPCALSFGRKTNIEEERRICYYIESLLNRRWEPYPERPAGLAFAT